MSRSGTAERTTAETSIRIRVENADIQIVIDPFLDQHPAKLSTAKDA